tara:strand:+ start:4816 stop:4941 length:126 start_codon:yes stop_codon:yes gene_type:complete
MNIEYIKKIQELFVLFKMSSEDFEKDIKILEKLIKKGLTYS